MQTIKKLSPELITKIAAGEVVERPASVVKELIENSIDAGATSISVYLEEGGAKKISIKDDGKGMHEDDVKVSFLPHTTSKLTSEDQLFSIKSFGFRGEALSTIAAVSNLTIRSREANKEYGFEVEVEQGELVRGAPVGMPVGTEICVENLFNSTPARRKFLKDEKTELAYISNLVSTIALSCPHIAFRLMHEDNVLLDVPHSQTLDDRFQALCGTHIAEHSFPIHHEALYGKVSGFVGKPQIAGRTKNHQYIFINNRAVSDELVTKTVLNCFGSLIEPRSFPIFTLFLSLPYENVDVNVHPRKEEVAFAHPQEVQKLLEEALSTTFAENDLTYKDPEGNYVIKDQYFTLRDKGHMDMHMATILRNEITPWHVKPQNEEIIQLHNVYLIAETPKGILMIDQHAAHERILFEQFKEAFFAVQNKLELYTLPEPIVFDLAVADRVSLVSQLEVFQKLGFDIEPFGNNSFKLSALPLVFKNREYQKLITEVLGDIKNNNKKLDRETERTLAFLACRTAIKAGDPLSPDERKELVTKLLNTDGIYTCPHGRPTHIEISLYELDKMFKRK